MNNTTRLRGHVEVDVRKVRTAWLSKKTSKYRTQVAALHLKHPAPRTKQKVLFLMLLELYNNVDTIYMVRYMVAIPYRNINIYLACTLNSVNMKILCNAFNFLGLIFFV